MAVLLSGTVSVWAAPAGGVSALGHGVMAAVTDTGGEGKWVELGHGILMGSHRYLVQLQIDKSPTGVTSTAKLRTAADGCCNR
jgi:hypothetical protein